MASWEDQYRHRISWWILLLVFCPIAVPILLIDWWLDSRRAKRLRQAKRNSTSNLT